MACVNSSGEITASARQILIALREAVPLSQVAGQTGLPLYRIRSAMRELSEAGLVAEEEGGWKSTKAGQKAVESASPPA